ncbi:MAG: ATP-binding cassette domain-containing protein [Acholeplasmatales bacterium]|nr:MAG: ATP-binding cassette domain-containing protein [Acholeplasmatales bacterium]
MYVHIENLSFSYPKTPVLHQLTFTMQKGEILAIIGSSGSGKSTLLRTLSGLEMPACGRIHIAGETVCDTSRCTPADKREVGFVFQDYALFPHRTVAQNIAFGLHKTPRKARQARVDALLEMIAMTGFARRYPHQLSGGQQQRVALARALAPMPKMLLLDEPFSNIDTDLKHTIRLELASLLKKANMTSILVTHDEEDARMLADRVIVLEGGRIVHEERVVRTPRH